MTTTTTTTSTTSTTTTTTTRNATILRRMNNLSEIPFVIFNDGRILYEFKEKVTFETSFGDLKQLVHKNNGSSISMNIHFDNDKNEKNQTFITKVKDVNRQLAQHYGLCYASVMVYKNQQYSTECFLSLERNDFSCVICNNWNVFTKLSDFESQYRQLHKKKFLVRSIVELYGVLYDNVQNQYQMVILCKRMQYFSVSCEAFPQYCFNVEEVVHENKILQNEISNLKKHQKVLEEENSKLQKELNLQRRQQQQQQQQEHIIPVIPGEKQTGTGGSEDTSLLSKNHPVYGKYLKMIEKRVPINAVRQKCMMENNILTPDEIEALLQIDPQSEYNVSSNPIFFIEAFSDGGTNSNKSIDLTSSQLGSFQLKKVNVDEERDKKDKLLSSNKNGLTITVDQLTNQMSKLRKTFFDFFT